ncbi:MAG: gamma carbonic anhydrase family protein [Bryobacteraceae bacterium]|jgi:Carbonic anhydrases/acetyltransferases, isoleucine patch superfamily|nr:gamma carbonic anhydrase family protein [Bryobacteraceae bacterium]
MIRAYRGIYPRVAASAYIDRSAQVIGDVIIGERSSVWCNTTLRGDVNTITIGDDSNVQDNAVMHGELDLWPVVVGDRVTIGHSAVIHGCVIEDDCLIGIGAIILNGARIGRGSVIAAGALVPEGMEIPPNSMVMGVPAKVRREVSPEERERFQKNAQNYIKYREAYREEPS